MTRQLALPFFQRPQPPPPPKVPLCDGQRARWPEMGRAKKERPVLSDLLLSLAAPAAAGIPFSLPFDCIAQLIRHIKDPHDFIAALAEEGIGNFRLS